MPFHLHEWLGGLGNQLFSLCIVYSLAKRHGTTFSLPSDTNVWIGHIHTVVSYEVIGKFLTDGTYKPQDITLPEITRVVVQFSHYTFTDDAIQNTIILRGLPMMYSMFSEYIPHLRNLISTNEESFPLRVYIGMRTFDRENAPHYRTSLDYYRRAIEYMSTKTTAKTIDVYTDKEGSSLEIIEYIRMYFGETCTVNEYRGSTADKSDIQHFYTSFKYTMYILCNSTFHYWAPMFSRTTQEVVYPAECEWYGHIASPSWARM